MNNWTIGKKLYAVVGTLATLLVLAGAYAMYSGSSLNAGIDTALNKTTQKVNLALRIQQNALVLRSEQRRALVAGFGNDLKTVEAADVTIAEVVTINASRIEQITPLLATEEGKKLVRDIGAAFVQWKGLHAEVSKLLHEGKTMEAWAEAKDKCNPLVDQADKWTDELLAQQDAFVKESVKDRRGDLQHDPLHHDRHPGGVDRRPRGGHRRGPVDEHDIARRRGRAQGRRRAGRGRVGAGGDIVAVAVAGRDRAGGVASRRRRRRWRRWPP